MPVDRGVIDRQLQELRESGRWWNERELRDLPAVLDAGEEILALSRGKIARVRWLRRSWLIVVTDRRLLCMRSGARASWRQFEVGANQIMRVSLRVGPFRGRVLVEAGGDTYRLLVPRPDAYKLSTALTSLGSAASPSIAGFGPARVVRRVLDHMLALPAAALTPATMPTRPAPAVIADPALAERLHALEDEVGELRRQVEFLEELLRQRQPWQLAEGAGRESSLS
jgi:hypothetical protein